ncbi:MAG: hypothetical protein JSW38_03185, partial [Dehalococcoidia bacterium]
GPLPAETHERLYRLRIKLLGSYAGGQDVSKEGGQVVIRLRPGTKIDRTLIQEYYGDKLKVGTTQLRLDTRQAGKAWRNLLEDIIRRIT